MFSATYRIGGIGFVLAGIACIVVGFTQPLLGMAMFITGGSLILTGVIWFAWGQFWKDTRLPASPYGTGLGGLQRSMSAMAASTAQANAMVVGLTNQAAAATRATGGLAARARVDVATDTGTMVNGNRVVDLQLTVTVPGYAPFAVRRQEVLSPVAQAQLHPGADVAASVNPANFAEVALQLPGV